MGRWLPWRDGLALLIALAGALAGLAVWWDGRVDIGMEVEVIEDGMYPYPGGAVYVSTVVPDGNAVRNGVHPGWLVTDLRTTDGSDVERFDRPLPDEWSGGDVLLPVEAVDSARLESVSTGYFQGEPPDEPVVGTQAQVVRDWLELRLASDINLALLGLGAGLATWGLLRQGLAGEIGRSQAVAAGTVVATPFTMATLVAVGNPIGIVLAYALPIGLALLLGAGLAATHPESSYRRFGVGAAVAATAIAVLFVERHMSTPLLSPDERGPLFAVIGAVALTPAGIASLSPERGIRDRVTLLTLGLLPGAALTLILPSYFSPSLALVLVAVLLGMNVVRWPRIWRLLDRGFDRVRSEMPLAASAMRERRDVLTGALVGVTAVVSLTQDSAWALVLGAAAGGGIGLAARFGVLGRDWTDAAVPLGAAVGVPILLVPLTWYFSDPSPTTVIPAALAALSVAHLVAERHADPLWRSRLFGLALLAALLAVIVGSSAGLAVVLLGAVAALPGVPVAFAERPGAQAISWRLETLAVALTPGVAATVLLSGGAGALLLGGWLAIIVVWRYVAILPLVGLANRTQLQRDVAVAAAETERARLAADLHDDALQQLTMLVRTLDESGNVEAANEAREVATKLRSVVGDLRLPILDDLGAGAALEWLVERVEPLAGGPVKLERSDETRPPANVELAVFRVAQEALTNAIKHGKAPIAVRYDVRSDGRVTLAIDDNGPGIGSDAAEEAPSAGHFGLLNMHQRAEQIGALLDVRRWPAGGTRVALEWRPQGS